MQSFLGGAAIVLTLVYFLLASGDSVLRKIVQASPRLADRQRAVDIAREMEQQISGVPARDHPHQRRLRGRGRARVVADGDAQPRVVGSRRRRSRTSSPTWEALICTVVIGLAALLAFDDIWWALLVPTVFFLINTLEGYVITPLIMGRRFTLDPALLFVGLLFWWFVWGTPGALLAVPMMAAFKIFCERVESLQPIAAFLGDDEPEIKPTVASTRPGTSP